MDMLQRFGRVAFITAFAVSFCAAQQWQQTASSPKGSGVETGNPIVDRISCTLVSS